MKTRILIMLLIGITSGVYAQELTENVKRTVRVKKPVRYRSAVEFEKMNVLYIGVDNPLRVAAFGNNVISHLELSEGVVNKAGDLYIARVSQVGIVTLSIFETLRNGSKALLETRTFRVKRIPDPIAEIGGKRGDSFISKKELLEANGLTLRMENFDFDLQMSILSFDLSVNLKGDLKTISSTGNRISADQKSLIQSCYAGSRVYIENIKVQMPDGTARNVASINLKLVN